MMDADDDARYGQAEPRRYYGKYPGTVSDNGPPSGGGSHRGQVKVKVPGILEETSDGNGQQPIEVLAYPAFLPGFFYVPDNDATVWVEFVAGDINFPIWTGVWYPDDKTPKATDAGQAKQAGSAPTLDQKIIRTTSGQVIQLDDTDGSEQLVVKDEKNGNAITFDGSGIVIKDDTNKNTITFSSSGIVIEDDTNKNTITFSSSGIVIKDDTNKSTITFDASGITIDASKGILLKCGDNSTITIASDHVQVKTSDHIELNAGTVVKIDSTAANVS